LLSNINPFHWFKTVRDYGSQHAYLTWQLSKRQLKEQYQGSYLGLGWTLIAPLLMLAVLTLVFNGIFKLKWPGTEELGIMGFALHVFIGMLIFNFFSDLFGRAPNLILSNQNLVTKVIFPLPILALTQVISSSLNLVAMLFVLIIFSAWLTGIHLSLMQLPLILAPLLIFMLGLVLLFSALGVYFRDIKQVNLLLTSLLMFLSPVFYPVSTIPPDYINLYMSNPLAQFMESVRTTMIDGRWVSLGTILSLWIESILTLLIGFLVFKKLKKGFADVL